MIMNIALILFGIFCMEASSAIAQTGTVTAVTIVLFWVPYIAGFAFSIWGLLGVLKEKRKEKQ